MAKCKHLQKPIIKKLLKTRDSVPKQRSGHPQTEKAECKHVITPSDYHISLCKAGP